MILNLTQHPATPDQRAQGVIDLSGEALNALKEALTFVELPTPAEIRDRADWIAALAADQASPDDREDSSAGCALYAMIGGAPFLMVPLETALREHGIEPCYAFSVRETEEQTQPDGSVRKINVFRHIGFIRTGTTPGESRGNL